MSVISYIGLYFLIGWAFTVWIDYMNKKYNELGLNEDPTNMTNLERVILTFLWPYGMFIFFRDLIRNLTK